MQDIKGQAIELESFISYADDAVISKTLLQKKAGTLTLFSFAKGQGLSEHASPFDAVAQVIEGTGTFLIDGNPITVKEGEMIIMPANVPHDVQAASAPFKMLLTMIRSED